MSFKVVSGIIKIVIIFGHSSIAAFVPHVVDKGTFSTRSSRLTQLKQVFYFEGKNCINRIDPKPRILAIVNVC